jgi:uridine kinase
MYVSVLPVLNLDGHNYSSSANSRLLRRIAKNASHRGTDAQKTILMRKSVRAADYSTRLISGRFLDTHSH